MTQSLKKSWSMPKIQNLHGCFVSERFVFLSLLEIVGYKDIENGQELIFDLLS